MERVSAFLEKLRIYLDKKDSKGEKLDKRLRHQVYIVLDHFLTVLAHTHKLNKGWKAKIKLAIEIGAFGKDPGVKEALAKFEVLVANVTSSEISVIVSELSEAAQEIRSIGAEVHQIAVSQEILLSMQDQTKDAMGRVELNQEGVYKSVDDMKRSDKQRQIEQEERERLEDIRKALNIQNSDDSCATKQNDFYGQCTEGSGAWLDDWTTFQRWAGLEEQRSTEAGTLIWRNDPNVLGLRAESGYGKTHLASLIIKRLLDRYGLDQKAAVGYYYFEGSDPKSRSSDQKPPSNAINKALRTIIYQLASDKTSLGKEYAKLIHKPCQSKASSFGKSADLWKILIEDFRTILDGAFFIVLDGLDESDKESPSHNPLAQTIRDIRHPADSSRFKIRMFLTGHSDALSTLTSLEGEPVPEVLLAPRTGKLLNRNDLLLYAEKCLSGMKIFTDNREDSRISDLMQQAIDMLVDGAQGDYKALDLKLRKIEQCRSLREVENELHHAAESKEDGVKRDIRALNLTLDEKVCPRPQLSDDLD
jgi:hypothetical protein